VQQLDSTTRAANWVFLLSPFLSNETALKSIAKI
jgi:hypothetical protein